MSIEPRVPEFPICDPGLLAVVGGKRLGRHAAPGAGDVSTGDFPLAGDKVNLADNAVTTRVKSMGGCGRPATDSNQNGLES